MHVRVSGRLTSRNIKSTLPEFRALAQAQFSDLTSLTDEKYPGDAWVPLHRARETFDASLGGPVGFDEWIIGALMINPGEAYGTLDSTAKVRVIFHISVEISHPCAFTDLGEVLEHVSHMSCMQSWK